MARKYLSPLNLLHLSTDPGTATEGDFYWNSSLNSLRVYSDGAWINASSENGLTRESFVATGSQTDFVTQIGWSEGNEQVYFNGLLLLRTSDYSVSASNTVTLNSPAASGDIVEIVIMSNVSTLDLSPYLQSSTAASTYLPLSGGTISSDLTISGNLIINGTTTNINSTNLVIEDKNIVLADVSSPDNGTANGAGITIKGATDKTLNWLSSTDAFTSSEHLNLASGKSYYKNGVDIKDVTESINNKTISGSSNTITNIGNSSLVNSSITINGTSVSLGSSVSIPTGSTSSAISSDITLSVNYKYFVDTTSDRSLTLPASPTLGDEIQIFDASGSAATHNITVSRNGNKITGLTEDAIIDTNGGILKFIYTGSTYGWGIN